MVDTPHISVVIPVYNGENHLGRCLEALASSRYTDFETLVVDDSSTDDSAAIAGRAGATVVTLESRAGPAAARNRGVARARGKILLFLDSDVLPQPDTLETVAAVFAEDPELAAVFGSYDDAPAEPNFFSQYKNLFHYFHHQEPESDATTFWAGCGAIRREVFEELSGFDEIRYSHPSIEDIELGYRLHRAGHRIRLEKSLQVKHLKRWGLVSTLKTDIVARAIPWSRLILETDVLPNQLNLRWRYRVSSALTGMLLACVLLSLLGIVVPSALGILVPAVAALVLLVVLVALNRELHLFFLRKRGLSFAARALVCHLLYYVYSGCAFVGCWVAYRFARLRA